MIRHYGNEAWAILGDAKSEEDLGASFGATLTEAEVLWLIEKEYAETAEDVIWRRTKLGLKLDEPQVDQIESFMRDAQIALKEKAAE